MGALLNNIIDKILEDYTPHSYVRGHHPNQYLKGNPKGATVIAKSASPLTDLTYFKPEELAEIPQTEAVKKAQEELEGSWPQEPNPILDDIVKQLPPDVQEMMKFGSGFHVRLHGLPEADSLDIINRLKEFKATYPNLASKLTTVTVIKHLPGPQGTLMGTLVGDQGKSQILIVPEKYAGGERAKIDEGNIGAVWDNKPWSVAHNAGDDIVHELGHTVSFAAEYIDNPNMPFNMAAEIIDSYGRAKNQPPISQYGKTDRGENFAELFLRDTNTNKNASNSYAIRTAVGVESYLAFNKKFPPKTQVQEAGEYLPHSYTQGHHPNQYIRGVGPQATPPSSGPTSVIPTPKGKSKPVASEGEFTGPSSFQQAIPGWKDIPLKGTPKGTGTIDDPIDVSDDLYLAAQLIGEGKHVRVNTPDEVAVLVNNLAAEVDKAKAAGTEAPDYDLCNITIKGRSLFCIESKDIPRVEMPQLSGIPKSGSPGEALPKGPKGEVDIAPHFIQALQENGIKVTDEVVPASHLKATQNQLRLAQIHGMASAIRKGLVPDQPIFVTRDNYIIDGHHRWASNVFNSLTQNKDVPMKVHKIDVDIGAGITFSTLFADYMGIAGKSAGQKIKEMLERLLHGCCG